MASSIIGTFKWMGVARDVYEQHLKKEFTDKSCDMDWDFKYTDPKTYTTTTIQRPNHGLVHTLRCAAYAPTVVNLYNIFRKAALNSKDIEDIQLVLLFYVVGRENEAGSKEDPYLKFRQKSAEIFAKYVRENLPAQFTQAQFLFYQNVLTDSCDLNDHRYIVTRISHNIDLLRCVSKNDYEQRLLPERISPHLGPANSQNLCGIVKECLRKTGDRIGGERAHYAPPLFTRCSTNVYFALRQINQVLGPISPIPIPLNPGQTNEQILDILCNLIEEDIVKKNSTLVKIFDNKAERCLSLPESTPLRQEDLRFYRLAKRLMPEKNKISKTALELLCSEVPAQIQASPKIVNPTLQKPAVAPPFPLISTIQVKTPSAVPKIVNSLPKPTEFHPFSLAYTMVGHSAPVRTLAFDMNKTTIASGSADKTIKLWNPTTGQCIKTLIGHDSHVLAVTFLDSSLLASGSFDQTIRLWDTSSGTCTHVLRGHSCSVGSLLYISSKKWLISGSGDGTIKVWDLIQGGRNIMTLNGHSKPIEALEYCHHYLSGNFIASASLDKTFKLWDLSTQKCTMTYGHLDEVSSLVYGAINNTFIYGYDKNTYYLVSGCRDKTIKVWDTTMSAITLQGHTDCVTALKIVDNHIISGSWDKTIKIWDPNSFKCLQTIEAHSASVFALEYNNGQLFSASGDATIKMWKKAGS